jgi:hypothetical protein
VLKVKNKDYNTTLEFVLALISTILLISANIFVVILTIQIQLNLNTGNTGFIIFDTIIEETTRTTIVLIGYFISIILLIFNLLLLKATFGIKKRKWKWSIYLIFVGIISISTLNIVLIIAGLLLIYPGIISIIKHNHNKI